MDSTQIVNVVVKRLNGRSSGKLVKVPNPCTYRDAIDEAKKAGLKFGYGTLNAYPPRKWIIVEDAGLDNLLPPRAYLVFEEKKRKRVTEFFF